MNENKTKYFKCPVHSGKTILFVKPPKDKAIAIYIYHGIRHAFGAMGHTWTLKEIIDKGSVEITTYEADKLLIS